MSWKRQARAVQPWSTRGRGGTAGTEEGTTNQQLLCTPFTFPRFLGQEELNKETEAEEPLTLGGKGCGHGEASAVQPGVRPALSPARAAQSARRRSTALMGRLIWFSFCLWKIGSNSIGPEERREEGSERRGALPAQHGAPRLGTLPPICHPTPARPRRTLHGPLDLGTAGNLSLLWKR